MTTEKVNIYVVNQNVEKKKKDGGSYKATTIITDKGEKMILQSTVDKSDAMREVLLSVVPGELFTLVHEAKEGSKFTNIVGVHKGDVPDAKSQVTPWSPGSGGSTFKSNFAPKSSFDSTGLQVGNALNNAALMLAHKAMKGTLETVAEDILRLGEKLKAKLSAGSYKYVGDTSVKSVSHAVAFVEEDIPFGDD